VLRHRASVHPERVAFTFLSDSDPGEESITFEDLDRKARAIAAYLEENNMWGERALLLLPSGLEYVATFFGCLYARVIAVPSFPVTFGRQRREASWFRNLVADARPLIAFTTPEAIRRAASDGSEELSAEMPRWVDPSSIDASRCDNWEESRPDPDGIGFLQYTSGSTSMPNGVMVSHSNIMHNQSLIQAACGSDEESTVVSWLPLHHDMGLIGTILQPVYIGARSVLMAPNRFLHDPVHWLRAISTFRGHSSTGPNFAYELCTRKISAQQKVGLDLTSWRIAINGAEPVRPETLERFAGAFAECGFRPEVFFPSYGLAEATLMVTGGRTSSLPNLMRISARELEQNVVEEARETETARILVGCGGVFNGQEVRIVNPETRKACPDNAVGEIWVSGASVAQGYWNRPEETELTFHAQLSTGEETFFLRTGDLGFLADGQLFITGRLKDLIILRGRNLYPQDVELTIQGCSPHLPAGGGAAFVVDVEGEDALVVVQEIQRNAEAAAEGLLSPIREALVIDHGIQAHTVVLIRYATIPRTTSGKIRRRECKKRYLKGELDVISSKTYPQAASDSAVSLPGLTRIEILQTDPELRNEAVESSLRSQLAGALKLKPEEVVANQPLIAMGIDSVLAVQLSKVVEDLSGVKFDAVEILKGCNLNDLVGTICQRLSAAPETEPSQEKRSSEKAYPLSYGQRGLWILHEAAPESTAYTLAHAVRAKELDVAALRRAFTVLLTRHPMLRSVFPAQAQGPVQLAKPIEQISLDEHFQYVDISSMPPEGLQARLEEEAGRPFVLEKVPPIRLIVLQLASGEYVLMMTLHHIIADLWSMGTILQELGNLYSGSDPGKTLAEPDPDYLKFVEWQIRTIDSPKGQAARNFWLSGLAGELPVLQLPSDRPRPPAQSYRGSSESLAIDGDLYALLKQIGRENGATPFMVLLAAFQVLLHRISGQVDLLLGCPTNGRSESAFSNVVGYCVNPVVIRSHYDPDMILTSFLGATREAVLRAFEHQDYPFPLLVEKLHAQRKPGLPPVFQVMFVWQGAFGGQAAALAPMALGGGGIGLQLNGLSLESIQLPNTGSQFDLTLMMAENGVDVQGLFKYSTDLFDAATIQNLAKQLSALLREIVVDSTRLVSTLPMMAKAERELLILDWSSGRPESIAQNRRIHELFEEEVRRHPRTVALVSSERQLTYAELNAQANQFARHLRGLGVDSEVKVGLCLERSIEMIVALLGIWKAGGAYVPFDAHDPKNRLSSLIEQSSIEVLITHERLLARLPDQLPQVVLLDLDLEMIALESESDLAIDVPSESLAYMIFTSGSTGQAKGTMIEHQSLLNLREGLKSAIYNAKPGCPLRVGLNAPLAFDSSIKQLLTLTFGHTLCLIPEDIRRNGQAFLEWMRESRLNVLDCTPTQLSLLLDAGFSDDDQVTLLVGGEPVPTEIWTTLAAYKSTPSYNVYGPTECTVDATACQIGVEASPAIGQPLHGTRVYLLDEHLEPVPIGVAAEMFIGGQSVGRGYLERPAATAEKFIPDPFRGVEGSRMYRTGDRARSSAHGNLQFIGRNDRQVKMRGFRIELGDVEAALCGCDGVQDAAAVVRNSAGGSKQLIAYVVASGNRDSSEYRQLLSQKIPEYMVPLIVATVPAIPTNANGKRDYGALPALDVAISDAGADFVPPKSAVEKHLAALWADILRVQPIGIHDNFFSLGGDSLQATKIIARVQESYPADAALLAPFLREPTIAALARLIDGAHTETANMGLDKSDTGDMTSQQPTRAIA
jgi:amino acid adenylation domain-containing protein